MRLLICLPRTWWLLAAVGLGVLGIAYAFIAPIVIDPLFNDFTPLAETEWRGQQTRVQALRSTRHKFPSKKSSS